ncbi:MAG: hypothetical protein R3B48_20430 [Kofleriaceae bacterium]
MRAALLLLALTIIAVAAPHHALVTGRATWDHAAYQAEIVPARAAAARALQRGDSLPLWWDESGLGVPLLEEPSHATLYAVTWLATDGHAIDLLGLAHVALLALAMAALASAAAGASAELAAASRWPLALAAVALTPAALAMVSGALASLTWLFAALACARRWADRGSKAAALATALALAGTLLAGAPGLAWLAAALVVAEIGIAPRRLLGLAAVLGLAALLSAAQWVPWLSAPPARPALELEWRPFAPLAIATILSVPLLLLAVVGRRWRWLASAAAMAVGALLFRDAAWAARARLEPAPLGLLAVGLLVLAAGAGAPSPRAARRTRRALAAAAAAWAVAAAAALSARGEAGGVWLAAAGVVAAAAALALPWGTRASAWRARVAALAGLALVSVAIARRAPQLERAAVDELPAWLRDAAKSEKLAARRRAGVPLRVFCPPQVRAPQVGRGVSEALRTVAATAAGWSCAQSRDRARAPEEDELWRRGAGAGGRLLRRLSIDLALMPTSTVDAVGFVELARSPEPSGGWSLVELPARPLAATYSELLPVENERAALDATLPPAGSSGARTDQLVVEAAPAARDASGPTPPEPCEVRSWAPGSIELACAPSAPSVASLAVAWAPGWQVDPRSAPRPALRVESVASGIALDAEATQVRWRYQPPGLALGLALTALGVLLVLTWTVRLGLQARRRRRGATA